MIPQLKISVLILLMAVIGCKKPAERKCFKSIGNPVIYTFTETSAISHLLVDDHIDVILYHDSLNYYQIVGGENLLPHIEKTILLDSLSFKDNNKCHTLRNHQNKITLHYHYSQLSTLIMKGYGEIKSADTLHHSIAIYSRNSFSKLNLTLNNDATYISIATGGVPIHLEGKTNQLYIFTAGESPVDASLLSATQAHGHTKGVNDFKLRATEFVNIELRGPGNVYVYGNPSERLFTKTGSGEIFEIP
jgi:hypothetical protein